MTLSTVEELKATPMYRYVRTLAHLFDDAGIQDEPMELPMRAVIDAPLPDYMSIAAAVKCKFLFLMCVYQNSGRFGSIQDAMPGMYNMLLLAMEEKS